MDYSDKIAAALTTPTFTAEVHKSTTARARYRVYMFDTDKMMRSTLLVGIEANGNITDEYRNVFGTINL